MMSYMSSIGGREVLQYLRADATSPFAEAFQAMRDPTAKARIDTALRKLERGLMPDVKAVGDGVHEVRIDYGPGYRVYFANDGAALIVLLLCGNKTMQTNDIDRAKAFWLDYATRKKTAQPTQRALPPRRPRRPTRRP